MNKKFFAFAVLMLLIPMMMGAQTLKGSYFLDNSLNRNKLNPAFAPRGGYFQMPVVGNFGVGALTNLEISTFMYPMNGQLYTFLNKNVTVDQFEAALPKYPYLDVAVETNLINFGFRAKKSFWTFDLGIKMNADVDLPSDLFLFMKKGTGESGSYNVGQVRANVAAAVTAALGYSRDLSDLVPGLRAGLKARAILPVAYAGLDLSQVNLTTSPEKWTLNTEGSLNAALKGLELTDAEGNISPVMSAPYGLCGWGLSFDLGAEYKLEFDGFINGVSFSAAVTDLGVIKYDADAVQSFTTEGAMDWTGFKVSLEEGEMDKAMDELGSEFEKLLELEKVENTSALSRSTLPSFYVGVEMPFCNNLMSIGALYSARKSYYHTRNELTLSYNLTPAKWFALGVNYSFLNVRKTLGCILEFTPKAGPCFYVGLDYAPVEWTNAPFLEPFPYLPMSARVNAQVGLAFSLGVGKDKKTK